jgi:hypothetical protein
MSKNILFAIDTNTDEVIVSTSPKGSNKLNLVARVSKQDNLALYHAVQSLTAIATAASLDASAFKALDKVCQLLYAKHNGLK